MPSDQIRNDRLHNLTGDRHHLDADAGVSGDGASGDRDEEEKALTRDEPAPPEKIPDSGWGLAAHVVDRLAQVLVTTIRGLLDRWVLIGVTGIIVTGVVVYCIATGNPPDALIQLVKLLIDLVGSTFWAVGGWLSAGVLALVGGGVILRQHRRIQEQGDLLAQLKDKSDPERVSSRRPHQLQDHVQMDQRKLLQRYAIVPAPTKQDVDDDEGDGA